MSTLATLAETSARLAATSKRLEKIELLAALLRQATPEAAELAVAYLGGEPRQGKVGVGYSVLSKMKPEPASEGSLTLAEVDRALTEMKEARGGAKTERLRLLLAQSTAAEQRFLAHLLTGEMRQGALEGILADAVAKAAVVDASRVRRAMMLAGTLAEVTRAALERGDAGLAAYDLVLFRPVQPMLAQTAEDVNAALAELAGEAALEYKMDGARVQVHRDGDEVRVYTRNRNDVTAAVPEVVELVRALPARSLILDGEVLAWDDDHDRPQPFQLTMRRFGRKLEVDALRQELPLRAYFFDALWLDGGALLDEPQQRRFAELAGALPAANVMPHLRTANAETAQAFVRQALAQGHEGVMAKSPAAPYAAGARGSAWLKIKQARTLDLVILAAEWGSGRRKGWLSNLHLGARDPAAGGYVMLGKTFKGLTDEMLAWQTRELLAREIARDEWTVFVEPELVAEIAFNEIQTSPRYPGGLALRFARVKQYRLDKSADAADTIDTVRGMA